MLPENLILWIPPWLVGAAFLAGMLAALEVGYRIGSWQARRRQDGVDLATILGGVIGMLGLLLGFTYAFSAERADKRKGFVLEEANAIGTAYLRASIAAEPVRAEIKKTLHEYLASRLPRPEEFRDAKSAAEAIARSEQVQAKLWPLAMRSLEGHEPNQVDALLLESINEVIDMHGRRIAAARDRIPEAIIFLLFAFSLVALGLCGFANGAAGRRNFFLTATLALLVSVVVMLVVDIDNPRVGLIRVSQQSLVDLEQSIRQDAGGPGAGTKTDPGKGRQ